MKMSKEEFLKWTEDNDGHSLTPMSQNTCLVFETNRGIFLCDIDVKEYLDVSSQQVLVMLDYKYDAKINELDYCINQLGFKGACIGSNVGGRPLDDPIFYPFYERMSVNRMPIHIHPRTPWETELFKDYRMTPMLGFEIDLCVAAKTERKPFISYTAIRQMNRHHKTLKGSINSRCRKRGHYG